MSLPNHEPSAQATSSPRKPRALRRVVETTQTLSEADLQTITDALRDETYKRGTRALYLLRHCPALTQQISPRAQLLYVHLAHLIDYNETTYQTDSATFSHEQLAGFVGCGVRQVSNLVAELTKTGPLPLLLVETGNKQKGQRSRFEFVSDPVAVAVEQEQHAQRIRAARHTATVRKQAQVMLAQAQGVLDPAVADTTLKTLHRQTDWNLPKRPRLTVAAGS